MSNTTTTKSKVTTNKDFTEENGLAEGVGTFIVKVEKFFEDNQKTIYIALGAVVVVVLGYFGLKKFYFEPRANEAAAEMFAAENYFNNREYEKALNGDPTINALGFVDIINDYSGTKSSNLARYYAGICELQLGNFDEALTYLKKYNGKDTYTGALAAMLCGDAESELGDKEAALKYYEKAASKSNDEIVAPTALLKAGLLHIALGNKDKAIKALETIKTQYPESTERSEVDKYIAYAEQMQ